MKHPSFLHRMTRYPQLTNPFFSNGSRQRMTSRDPSWLRSLLAAAACGLCVLVSTLLVTMPAQAQAADRIVYSLGLHANDSCLTNVSAGAVRGADGTVYWASQGSFCTGLLSSRAPNGTYTTLHAFNDGHALDITGNSVGDVGNPRGTPIIASDGNLYGIGTTGGANGQGGFYRYRLTGPNAGEYRVLYSLQDQTEGCYGLGDVGSLIEGSDGNLYGTTSACGGPNFRGTVFKLTKAGVLTVLKNFSTPATAADGSTSRAALTQGTDGAFYGSTTAGGTHANGGGTIFRVTADGTFTLLHSFAGDEGVEGSRPSGAMALGSDGNFYGTTEVGGPVEPGGSRLNGRGTVFRITPAGVFTRLYTFYGDSTNPDGVTGVDTRAGLVRAGDGNFYGVTSSGGSSIYRVTPAGVVSQVYAFQSNFGACDPNGYSLVATLTLGGDGLLYGTTQFCGLRPADTGNNNPNAPDNNGGGTVFSFNINGSSFTRLITLSSTPTEGRFPSGALVQASNGSFYGVTATDASTKKLGGTIFSLTPGGVLNTVHVLTNNPNFSIEGRQPEASLTIGPDGAFYGTAEFGGVNSVGSVFRVTAAGDYTTLYNFAQGTDGFKPAAALTLGNDGNFYGTAQFGGTGENGGSGTIFRISPSGTYTKLYDFAVGSSNVRGAPGKLLLASDGNFYGTTVAGSPDRSSDLGAVYRMTPAGVVTVLHTFTGPDGVNPLGGVIQGADGALYGTTAGGGSTTRGTVFRVTLAGVYSTIHTFTNVTPGQGISPSSLLLLARDSNFYGTARNINFNDSRGLVYRLTPQGQYSVVYRSSSLEEEDGLEDEPIQASDGDLYVATRNDGAFNFGSVIAISGPADRVLDLSASAGPGSAVLSWSTVPRALSYNVYRGTAPGGEGATPIATGVTAAGLTGGYTATGLTAGTLYYFTVTAVNALGQTQFSNEVSVRPTAPVPTVSISATPQTLTLGASSTLTWGSSNATTCTASGAWTGSRPTSGSTSVTPATTGNAAYTLTCTGVGGSGNATVTVTVNPAGGTPTVRIAANPKTITLGASTTLTWSSTNARSCAASGAWKGARSTSGTARVRPTITGTVSYKLTCTGSGGTKGSATTKVTVRH